jgi:hypothetical protein
VLAWFSPDAKRIILISGNRGIYRARLISGPHKSEISGIAAGADLRWISSTRFIYRCGTGGDYSARVYDSVSGRSLALVSESMNTDISFSDAAGMISCLENQMITLFEASSLKRIDTGIEGEEVYFSPDGRKFTSIYLGKLYVNSLNMMQKSRLSIRRNAEKILTLYKKAAAAPAAWENDYSQTYIEKKMKQYKKFIRATQ